MEYHLSCPTDRQQLSILRAGDTIFLSGVIYTARDAAHKRLLELLDQGKSLPFPIEGSAIYYVGPTPERPGQIIGSAGPTTSGRMDPYTPRLLDMGLAVMVGKGARSKDVVNAIIRNGAVYLAALGGAGLVMSQCVQSCEVICWEDLGCEALRRLVVRDMPLTVVIDSIGNDLYLTGPSRYNAAKT